MSPPRLLPSLAIAAWPLAALLAGCSSPGAALPAAPSAAPPSPPAALPSAPPSAAPAATASSAPEDQQAPAPAPAKAPGPPPEPRLAWSRRFADDVSIEAAASAPGGGVVVAGRAWSELSFGKKSPPKSGFRFLVLAGLGDDGSLRWSARHAMASGMLSAVRVAPSGGLVVAGVFQDGLAVCGAPARSTPTDEVIMGQQVRREDAFVAGFDATGRCRWRAIFGGKNDDSIVDLAADDRGGAAAILLGAIARDKTPGTSLVRLDPGGKIRWSTPVDEQDLPAGEMTFDANGGLSWTAIRAKKERVVVRFSDSGTRSIEPAPPAPAEVVEVSDRSIRRRKGSGVAWSFDLGANHSRVEVFDDRRGHAFAVGSYLGASAFLAFSPPTAPYSYALRFDDP